MSNVIFKNKIASIQDNGSISVYAGLQAPITIKKEDVVLLEKMLEVYKKIFIEMKGGKITQK